MIEDGQNKKREQKAKGKKEQIKESGMEFGSWGWRFRLVEACVGS